MQNSQSCLRRRFRTNDGWISLDNGASTAAVQRADLLGRMPLPDGHATLVYSKHFPEYFPNNMLTSFLCGDRLD